MPDQQLRPACRLGAMVPRLVVCSAVLLLSTPAVADVSTVSVADATVYSAAQPVTIGFPLLRSGDLGYDTVVSYQTFNGTATAGTDYLGASAAYLVPAGAIGASIPVTILPHAGGGADQTFELYLAHATGVGPAPSFAGETGFSAGSNTVAAVSADINGDGRPDVIVANFNDGTLSVLLNTAASGATAPSFATQQTFATGSGPRALVVADINGDGKPDLIVPNYNDVTVSVLVNTTPAGSATATFATQQTFVGGFNSDAVAVADVNGDGKPDILVANYFNATVSVLLNTTAPGSLSAAFAARQTFTTGNNPHAIAVADFNGDGKPDLVVANFGATNVSVLFNTTATGSSTAAFAAKQDLATGANPVSVDCADVNGDGKLDIVAANYADGTVSVLLNTTSPGSATASFAAQVAFAAGSTPTLVAARDVNADGRPDLLIADASNDGVWVLANHTAVGAVTPVFSTQRRFGSGFASSVALADLNADGLPDLVVANNSFVDVLFNTTSGGISQQTFAANAFPYAVIAADINGDGKPDLVSSNAFPGLSISFNTTPAGATPATFAAQQQFATSQYPSYSVAAADINGDGKPDLITANFSKNNISVLLNTTAQNADTATFTQQTFPTGNGPQTAAVADINGDGKPDIVVANNTDGTVWVLLNTTPAGAATATFSTQTPITVGTFPYALAITDINGDGKPDVAVANAGTANVSVLLNTTANGSATATFAAQQKFGVGNGPNAITTADLNGDGKPDLIVSNSSDGSVSTLLNTTPVNGTVPTFLGAETVTGFNAPDSVAALDARGFGLADVIVASQTRDSIYVLVNLTAQNAISVTFLPAVAHRVGLGPNGMAVQDVDGDGHPELLVADAVSNAVSVIDVNALAAPSPPTFAAQTTFSTGLAPDAVTSCDLNGDGRPDLIAANYGGNSISVFLDTTTAGASTPSYSSQGAIAVGTNPLAIGCADLDGDGRPDLAVANSGSNNVSLLLNTTAPGAASASFSSQPVAAVGTFPLAIAIGDLNGDGKPDIVVANAGPTGNATVLLNTSSPGAIGFSPAANFTAGTGPAAVTLADIDDDGMLDMVVANQGSSNVSVLRNTTLLGGATPSFASAHNFAVGSQPTAVAAADINGDGKLDLVVANFGSDNVSVLRNNAVAGATVPSFAAQQSFATASAPVAIAAADIDADGQPDVVVGTHAGVASVLRNATTIGANTIAFDTKLDFSAGSTPSAIALADADGDGRPDLVVANSGGNTVSVLLNTRYRTVIGTALATGTISHDRIFASGFNGP